MNFKSETKKLKTFFQTNLKYVSKSYGHTKGIKGYSYKF